MEPVSVAWASSLHANLAATGAPLAFLGHKGETFSGPVACLVLSSGSLIAPDAVPGAKELRSLRMLWTSAWGCYPGPGDQVFPFRLSTSSLVHCIHTRVKARDSRFREMPWNLLDCGK
ncbi:hypothetical protein K431DRAFT_99426 [Polychaeton citri CBS 116435]|uniref:Uncharacterized protein n=1 Tax=Polychaeton citri CBS 116435 TaxID=1314669 RepID=A0A9P4UUL1_9PEZI|nr:hypothetical protein K431DRAFT_99426 [Polychaeton citri CBS 116435]